MFDLGSQTGKQRELLQEVEQTNLVSSSIVDSNKNVWQKSYAQVISVDENYLFYKVVLLNENKTLEAMLHGSYESWKKGAFGKRRPEYKDYVEVEHKKDLFYCKIIKMIEIGDTEKGIDGSPNLFELNKRYMDEDAYSLRYDNMPNNNEDEAKTFWDRVKSAFQIKNTDKTSSSKIAG